jgi:hypothetical protein
MMVAHSMKKHLAVVLALVAMSGCGATSLLNPEIIPEGENPNCKGIPHPGTTGQVNIDFQSMEPNDTPEEATPLGVANDGDLIMWVGANPIGGSDNPANYFVFQSGPTPSQLEFNMCYGAPITGMTASLWQVVDCVQQTPPVATWTIGTTCTSNFSAPLEASSVYLFGVEATGEAGTYTA